MGIRARTFWPSVLISLALHGLFIGGIALFHGQLHPSQGHADNTPTIAPAKREKPEPNEKPAPRKVEVDPLRDAFARLVQQNAADPAGFEVIEWATLGEEAGIQMVRVKFRCKLIGHTPNVKSRTIQAGDTDLSLAPAIPVPVSVDEAIVAFKGDKLVSANLSRAYAVWHAR